MEYVYFIIKILLLLPFIFFLIIASLKLTKNIQGNSKYIKIIERAQIAPNTFIAIVKIIDKTYVMVTTNNSSEIISELTNEFEFDLPNKNYINDLNIHSFIEQIRRKMTNEKK